MKQEQWEKQQGKCDSHWETWGTGGREGHLYLGWSGESTERATPELSLKDEKHTSTKSRVWGRVNTQPRAALTNNQELDG